MDSSSSRGRRRRCGRLPAARPERCARRGPRAGAPARAQAGREGLHAAPRRLEARLRRACASMDAAQLCAQASRYSVRLASTVAPESGAGRARGAAQAAAAAAAAAGRGAAVRRASSRRQSASTAGTPASRKACDESRMRASIASASSGEQPSRSQRRIPLADVDAPVDEARVLASQRRREARVRALPCCCGGPARAARVRVGVEMTATTVRSLLPGGFGGSRQRRGAAREHDHQEPLRLQAGERGRGHAGPVSCACCWHFYDDARSLGG